MEQSVYSKALETILAELGKHITDKHIASFTHTADGKVVVIDGKGNTYFLIVSDRDPAHLISVPFVVPSQNTIQKIAPDNKSQIAQLEEKCFRLFNVSRTPLIRE